MSRKGKRELLAPVFRGHAIAPEVRKEWSKMTRQVNGDLEALRRGLTGTSGDLTVGQEQLLVSFANAALTERVLNAQGTRRRRSSSGTDGGRTMAHTRTSPRL